MLTALFSQGRLIKSIATTHQGYIPIVENPLTTPPYQKDNSVMQRYKTLQQLLEYVNNNRRASSNGLGCDIE
jgi:hypothetical protein